MADGARTVTMLLRGWRGGDRTALDELVPLIYAELHRLATSSMRGERPGHTLRPSDLVSEAYLRLADAGATNDWSDRAHFFAIAARTMRQILVDHARKRNTAKRGDGARPVTFDETLAPSEHSGELVAVDEAIEALAALDERKARIIELHYFGGLTQTEVADVLGVHVNTVIRDLKLAVAWMRDRLA